MIVKNEAENIERAIKSLEGAYSELIVVDTGSTDETVRVAERLGAYVCEFPWIDDFGKARQFAHEQATMPWCMFIDADEEAEPGTVEVIKQYAEQKPDRLVASIVTQLVDSTEHISQARLYPREGTMWKYPIHEQVVPLEGYDYEAGKDDELRFVHHADYRAAIDKSQRNLRILDKAIQATPEDTYIRMLWAHVQFTIKPDDFENLFTLRRCILDFPEKNGSGYKLGWAVLESYIRNMNRDLATINRKSWVSMRLAVAMAHIYFSTGSLDVAEAILNEVEGRKWDQDGIESHCRLQAKQLKAAILAYREAGSQE